MLKEILSKLMDEKVEIATGGNSTGKTLIAQEHLERIAGGRTNPMESLYQDYAQNIGDPGPHPRPYWQDIR